MNRIINPYGIFIFCLVLFIINYLKKRNIFIKKLGIKTFKYIPISYMKSITISYLRLNDVKDSNSLILLNLLYISIICQIIESSEKNCKLRCITDILLLMTFIQETTQECWNCNFGNFYYSKLHHYLALITINCGLIEAFYFKYKLPLIVSFYFLLKTTLNVPFKYILNKKMYKKISKKTKKFINSNMFFAQFFCLLTMNISRIKYDMLD